MWHMRCLKSIWCRRRVTVKWQPAGHIQCFECCPPVIQAKLFLRLSLKSAKFFSTPSIPPSPPQANKYKQCTFSPLYKYCLFCIDHYRLLLTKVYAMFVKSHLTCQRCRCSRRALFRLRFSCPPLLYSINTYCHVQILKLLQMIPVRK